MKKLFALVLMGLCAQSFCMNREIGPDMGYAQGGSALVNIASNDSLAETLGDMERKYKALLRLANLRGQAIENLERYNSLLRLVNHQGRNIRDLVRRNAAEDMERYNSLLRLVNHQGRNIRDLVRRNAAEGMERKYNALLRLVNLQDQTIRDLAGRNAAFEESVQTLDDK